MLLFILSRTDRKISEPNITNHGSASEKDIYRWRVFRSLLISIRSDGFSVEETREDIDNAQLCVKRESEGDIDTEQCYARWIRRSKAFMLNELWH